MKVNYENRLDKEQLKAVEAPVQNISVLSVAGSGKTTVITNRIANMAYHGYDVSNMLLLTFTNAAAKEMTERTAKILGTTVDNLELTAGTFHSVAHRLLRDYNNATFTIINDYESKELMRTARTDYISKKIKENPVHRKLYNDIPGHFVIYDIYSGAFNHSISFDESVDKYSYVKDDGTKEHIMHIISLYNKYKEDDNAYDFDDLLRSFLKVLKEDMIFKMIINDKFKYIFVDEYQDINQVQFEILQLLNSEDKMFIVGDKAQSIYQFRGSEDKYITTFKDNFKNVIELSLPNNYRSTPEILSLAEKAIEKNNYTPKVKFVSHKPSGPKPTITIFKDSEKQAHEIMKYIKKHYSNNYSDVAILIRRNSESMVFELEASKLDVPFKTASNISFIDQYHIKDMLSLFHFMVNKKDENNFTRFVKTVPGIYNNDIAQMYNVLKNNDFKVPDNIVGFKPSIQNVFTLMKDVDEYVGNGDIEGGLTYLYKNHFQKKIANNNYINEEKKEEMYMDIEELMKYANKYDLLHDFIGDLMEISGKKSDNENSVNIISMHRSKGLEWDYVFLPNMTKEGFPIINFQNPQKSIKDERNLFYVAITRAKKELHLTLPHLAAVKKNDKKKEMVVSQFVYEVSNGLEFSGMKGVKYE